MNKLIKLVSMFVLTLGIISQMTVEVSEAKTKVSAGLEIVKGAPTSFKNCTAMKKYYPNGVKKGHPAYELKHDRDKDGWACETSR